MADNPHMPKLDEQTATEQLAILRQQLDQAQRMALVGELTSTTTHEFNNLLMTIINYAKLGLRHQDSAGRDKAFQRIFDAAQRAAKVASSVLAVARSGSGKLEPTELRPVLESGLMLMDREFQKYRIHLESQLDSVPAVRANSDQILRVVMNLLVNARQATSAGGSVVVRLQSDSVAREVQITIRDTGTGIPADVLPRIFDPYFTTKSGPDSSGRGGTGIGLSSCKEVIDSHGGRIRVESTVGKGTAFLIRLPICEPARAQAS